MPRGVMHAQNAGLGARALFESIPPITRTWLLLVLGVTVAGNYGYINPVAIALIWKPVIKKFEIWRLLTNFLFLGALNFNFIIRLIWIFQHSVPLESQSEFQFEPADFLWMLTIIAGLLCAASPFTHFVINGVPLIMAIIYMWSRTFPDRHVSLYGLLKIQSFYLPWAFVTIDILLGQSLMPDLVGIGAGHIYYYLKEVYPVQTGRTVLISTPAFLKNWLADIGVYGVAPPPRQQAQREGAPPTGFQTFQGAGRRLQD